MGAKEGADPASYVDLQESTLLQPHYRKQLVRQHPLLMDGSLSATVQGHRRLPILLL